MNEEQLYSPRKLLIALSFGALWMVGLWGFWTKGVFALGFNATLFLLLLGGFLLRQPEVATRLHRRSWTWLVPLAVMALSYSLFENPFVKLSHFIAFPVAWSIMYRHASRAVEAIYGSHFETRQEMEYEVFEYIERFYKKERRHSTINRMAPVEYEKLNIKKAVSI